MAEAKGFHSKEDKAVGAVFDGVYVLEGKRTPFGRYTGSLSSVSPTDLGIISSRATIAAAGVDAADIDQTIVANIGQASADSFFLPRHIGLYSGTPEESSALMVQRICGSGIELVGTAAEQIALGKSELILGCGAETMSRFPLASFGARQGFRLGKPEFVDMLWEALDDTAATPMGVTADTLAKKFKLNRDEIDAFAMRSQERYFKALEDGFFDDEITAVEGGVISHDTLKPRKVRLNNAKSLTVDENPRKTNLEKLAKLAFVFSKEGPTTAGTASGIVDGAASVLVASDTYVKSKNLNPIGRVRAVATVGVDPSIMGIGPVPAIKSVLSSLNLGVNDVDLFEINEAFGAQCLSCAKALEIDEEKLNIHGGAIAIGHPLAATGTRLIMTCLKALKKRNGKIGVVSACIGGGQGIAMVVEAL